MTRIRKPPSAKELAEVFEEEVSLTGLASRYGVSFSTVKKWVSSAHLQFLDSAERMAKLKQIIQDSPLEAKRRRISENLESTLRDEGDRKLLARAIVDEFNLRYTLKRSGHVKRRILWLKVTMYDGPPVEQVAKLMGTRCKMRYRKAKSGVEVPYWNSEVNGFRAYKVLQLVRPYLVGQKAFQADLALKAGPLCDAEVPLGKEEYKRLLFSQVVDLQRMPAPRLPDSSRKSVAPGRRAV